MGIYIVPFVSSISPEVLDRFVKDLEKCNVSILLPDDISPDSIDKNSRYLIFVGTGGTENLIAEFLNRVHLPNPIILLSHELINSLPAALELRSYLVNHDNKVKIIHRQFKELLALICEWTEFSQIEETIRSTQLYIIGKPSAWLIGSKWKEDSVYDRWGLEFGHESFDEIFGKLIDEPSQEFKKSMQSFLDNSTACSVKIDEVSKAVAFTETLSNFINEKGISLLTVECFKLFGAKQVSGCHALSYLNDQEGITAGCEGDVPTTFTMFLARLLTKQPVFMANVADLDEESNTAVFAHCTVPRSVVKEYEITTHFETGQSVAIRGKFEQQEVTIFKVSGESLMMYWLSTGRITENLVSEDACRTQIRVELDEPVSDLLENTLANHYVIIPGNYKERIEHFMLFTDLRPRIGLLDDDTD